MTESADPTAPADSAAWSRRIAAGDEAAFAAFYAHWHAPTLALAKAASRRDEACCMDLVHDVMLQVARRLPPLPSEAAVAAWLKTAVLNRVIDQARREARRQRRERTHAAAQHAVGDEPWLELAVGEQRSWLGRQLADLPELDRNLLLARFGDGSVTAVGQQFGIGADAAHGRLRRALIRMRQRAAEWWHG